MARVVDDDEFRLWPRAGELPRVRDRRLQVEPPVHEYPRDVCQEVGVAEQDPSSRKSSWRT